MLFRSGKKMFLGLVNESFWIKKKFKSRIVLHVKLRSSAIAFPLLFGSIGRKEHVSCFG